MSIKVKYFLFIGIIHILLTGLVLYLLWDHKLYFFPVEILVIISLYLSYQIYSEFIRPLQFMYTGIDAIRDEDFNVKFLLTGSKEMDKLILVYNEMIDNIRKERIQTQEQHFFLQRLINASPAGIIIFDYDENIAEINPRAIEMLNLREVEKKQLHLRDHPHPVLRKLPEILPGQSKIIDGKGLEKFKCQVSHFIHRGFKRKFVLIQELSREILAAEKRAYGKVIRMMAHEVNNSIGAINSILHSLQEMYTETETEESEDFREGLRVAIDRNYSLNQFMKNFAEVVRLPKPVYDTVSLHKTIQQITRLMEVQAQAKKINFEFVLHHNDIILSADPQQLEQALVNIIKNAMEAIEESGTVRFITSNRPNRLIIADNGSGISTEIADRIFTPFFSTKPTGQGVGLTLVREILSNHQVQFTLQSQENGWTEFQMTWGVINNKFFSGTT